MDYQAFSRAFDTAVKNAPARLPHVYLLAGEEPYLISAAEEKIINALLPDREVRQNSLKILDGEADADIIEQEISAVPFFGDNIVTIVRRSKIFGEKKSAAKEDSGDEEKGGEKAALSSSVTAKGRPEKKTEKTAAVSREERALNNLLGTLASMPETNYVIFEAAFSLDKRRKLTKSLEKLAFSLEANRLRPWQAAPWFEDELKRRGLRLDMAAREYLTGALGNLRDVPLGYLANEIAKLELYLAAKEKNTDEKFSSPKVRQVTLDDITASFSRLPEISGFAIAEAIDLGDTARAISLLHEELATGTYLPVIAGLLVKRVREYILTKELLQRGLRGKALSAALGQKGFYPSLLDKLVRAANRRNEAVLRRCFLALAEADYRLKTGGAGPELIEKVIIDLKEPPHNLSVTS